MAEEIEENIKVVVRVRDLIPREKGQKKVHEFLKYECIYFTFCRHSWWRTRQRLSRSPRTKPGTLTASIVLWRTIGKACLNSPYDILIDNSRSIYADTAATMIENTIAGFNATIFAYGQTSSGKFSSHDFYSLVYSVVS